MQVTRLCDLSVEGDSVTSVGWSERVRATRNSSPSRRRALVREYLTDCFCYSGESRGRGNTQRVCTDLGRSSQQETVHARGTHSPSR